MPQFSTTHITRLTSALYGNAASFSLENLRDSLSTGQLESKWWLYTTLLDHVDCVSSPMTIHHIGCWHGLLSAWIAETNANHHTYLVDPDTEALKIADRVHSSLPHTTVNEDGAKYISKLKQQCSNAPSLILNTSCEHMTTDWISELPQGSVVVAQSTDYLDGEGHILPCATLEEFISHFNGVVKFAYTGTLVFPMYSRFMVIGAVS